MLERQKWSWLDWSLSRRDPHGENWWVQIFALKCALCHRFTLGGWEHPFGGLCKACRQLVDEAADAD